MSNASLKTTTEWNDINWAKVQRKTFKLQKRIFQAVKSGQKAKARNLQKLLVKSHSAKLLAVRRVTQDNQGKNTAGVDGVKIVLSYQRDNLAKELTSKGYKSKALRRVWIPKPGRDEKRPLGIPTIKDRAMQALVKSALEPYWEAQFEGTSYGFRPGRSAHDAIGRIYTCINQGSKYVLDADIAKCFDQINHDYLMSKLDCPTNIRFLIKQWLKKAGLELKPEKTRICHSLNEITIEGQIIAPGFDFLGFNIRSYPVGRHHSGRTGGLGSQLIGFKTIIKPSKKSIKAHHEAIKAIIKRDKKAPQAALINHLNPIIRGWCNYFRTVASKETFSSEDYQLWQLLRAWTVSRTGKADYKKLSKYFSHGKHGAWTFQTRQENGYVLAYHAETEIKRHPLVKPEASPYDGNWTYWSKRRGEYPDTPLRVTKLLKKQKGYCNHCHQSFTPDDIVEVDHIIPKSKGGKDEYKNLQLLHRHCHDNKTRYDGSLERNFKPIVPLPEDYRWENDMLVIVPMTRVN